MICVFESRIKINNRCAGYYLRWYYNGWHYWLFYPGRIGFVTEGEKYRTLGTQKLTVGSGQITEEQCDAIRTIMNTREVYIYTDSGWGNVRIDEGSWIVYDHGLHRYEAEIVITIGSKYISRSGFSPVTIVPVVPAVIDTSICSLIIGTQVWMCKNYDSNYPGSKVYNNDEANRALYGGLYTANMIMAAGFCPPGWHVPTQAEWQILIDYVGGLAASGGALKETGVVYWDAPNEGAVDSVAFAALGSGIGSVDPISHLLTFSLLKQYSYLWTQTSPYAGAYNTIRFSSGEASNLIVDISEGMFSPVRLIKDTMISGVLMDLDNNVYTEVIIGTQAWIVENLKVTKYADGTPIPNITNPGATNLLTAWTNGHGGLLYDTFTDVGKDITSAISDTYAYCKSNTVALVAGDVLRYDIDLTLNAGNLPEVVLFKNGSPSQATSLLNGLNTGGFAIMSDDTYGIAILSPVGGTDFSAVCSFTTDLNLGWINDTAGAYCWYDNDIANKNPYGALYNQYASNNAKGLAHLERGGVLESSWRIPSDVDWDKLIAYLGGSSLAGGKLKEIGLAHWLTPNTGATDEHGFTALPAGLRSNIDGSFLAITQAGYLWSTQNQFAYQTSYIDQALTKFPFAYATGLSVRLVRDITNSSQFYYIQKDVSKGAGDFRLMVRDGSLCYDQALTGLGFDGAESLDEGVTGDWINRKKIP